GFTPYGTMPPSEAFPRAKAAAQKALALDSSAGEAYASVGLCAFYYDWNWLATERAFGRSLEISPHNPKMHSLYAACLAALGRSEQAVQHAQRATELDPLSGSDMAALALVLYFVRRYDEGIPVALKAIELDPGYPSSYVYLAFNYHAIGQIAEAIEYYKKSV